MQFKPEIAVPARAALLSLVSWRLVARPFSALAFASPGWFEYLFDINNGDILKMKQTRNGLEHTGSGFHRRRVANR